VLVFALNLVEKDRKVKKEFHLFTAQYNTNFPTHPTLQPPGAQASVTARTGK